MSDTISKVLEIRVNTKSAIENLTEYENTIKRLSEAEKNLKKMRDRDKESIKNDNSLSDEQKKKKLAESERFYANELRGVAEAKKALTAQSKALAKQVQNEAAATIAASGSLTQQRAKLAALKKVYADLDPKMKNFGSEEKRLRETIKSLTKSISEQEKELGVYGRNVGNYASAFKSLWKTVGVQMLGGFLGTAQAFVAIGNAIKSSVENAIQFNRSVSKMQAILRGTTGDMNMLVAKAKELGATTRYTATEVVQLQTELAKLGYQQDQIIRMSESVLFFAQATGSSLPDAASLAGASLRMFGKDVSYANEYIDQMALATTKSALTFDYIKTALPIVGSTAKTFGFELNEVLAMVGQLANNGLEASMAATATRNILLRLADANGELAKQLGRPVKNIHDLVEGLKELKRRGVDLNDTLQLTDKRSVNAFNAFLRAGDATEKLATEIKSANGVAKEMAETMEDNLGGDITRLSSVWEDFTLSLNKSQGPLRTAVKWLQKVVKGMADIVRSADESIRIAKNQSYEDYLEGGEMSISTFEDISKFEKLVKTYTDMGFEAKDAIDKSYNEVRDAIINDEKLLQIEYENAINDRIKFSQNEGKRWAEESTEELQRDIQEEMDVATKQWSKFNRLNPITGGMSQATESLAKYSKDEIETIKKLIEYRTKEAEIYGKLESQKIRIQELDEYINEETDPNGIPVLDAAARNKQNQLEKRIAKARLDAEKKLETDLYNLGLEGADKRRNAIEMKYDQEIATVRYKLKEELRVLEEEANEFRRTLPMKAWVDLEAAKDAYKVMLEEREGVIDLLKKKELALLEAEENERQLQEFKSLLQKRIEGVEKESAEEYLIRKQMLDTEEASEMVSIEKRFQNEEVLTKEQLAVLTKMREENVSELKVLQQMELFLEEEKCKRMVAINAKYEKKRAEIAYNERVTANKKAMYSQQSKSLASKYDGVVANAKANLAEKELERNNLVKGVGESPESFTYRRMQAYDAVLQARMQLSQAIIEADTHEAEMAMINSRMEIDSLKAKYEYQKKYEEDVVKLGRFAAESQEEFEKRKAEASKASYEAQLEYSNALFQIWADASNGIATSLGTISSAIAECCEENEENVRRSKILGLAQVYIEQAVAIANAIRLAWTSSSNWIEAIAATATSITTVVASTVQAISSIKKAKYAKGVIDLQGPGTSTSDSIDARLSKGESVMTARATKLFKPLLAAMNQIAAQPNVTLPNMYSQYNPSQTMANNESFGKTMREAMQDVHPVVSVTEINDVNTRLQRIKVLDNI